MSYLLRVVVPDRPGALGAIATALGQAEADIHAVDVVEHLDDGTAVDDFVVDLPPGRMPDSLVSACQQVEGVRVAFVGHYLAGDGLHRDLEAIEALTDQPDQAERILVKVAPEVFHADWALVVRRAHGTLEILHAGPGSPGADGFEVPWLPIARATALDTAAAWAPEAWRDSSVAAAPLGHRDRAIVVGRNGGPEMLDSEVARLWHLATLAVSVQTSAEPSEGTELVEHLDHLVLTVHDIKRTMTFYRDVLGMRAVTYGGGRRSLVFGRQKFNLHEAGSEIAPHARAAAPGSADVCLIASVPMDAVLERLAKHDVPVVDGPVPRTGTFRHGTLSLYAALNTASGEVLGKTTSRHTSAEFVVFLHEVVASVEPGREIHIIADNLSAHKTKAVEAFLGEHPCVHLHFTPTYSSWLNQVEIWFSKIQRDIIARGVFESKADLARKIMRYIRHYNKAAVPFRWSYQNTAKRIR